MGILRVALQLLNSGSVSVQPFSRFLDNKKQAKLILMLYVYYLNYLIFFLGGGNFTISFKTFKCLTTWTFRNSNALVSKQLAWIFSLELAITEKSKFYYHLYIPIQLTYNCPSIILHAPWCLSQYPGPGISRYQVQMFPQSSTDDLFKSRMTQSYVHD